MTIREFDPLTIIGRGAFGEVRICRQKENGDIVAIKKMRKEDMLNKNQLMHVRTEKEILKNNMIGTRKELGIEELIKAGKITSKTFDRVSIVKSYIEKKYSLKTQKTDEKNRGKPKFIIIKYII